MATTGKLAAVRRRTHEILEETAPGDWFGRIVDIALITLIATNVLAVILESVAALRIEYQVYFRNFEVFSVTVFTVEYLLRLWSCVEREDAPAGANPFLSRLRYAVTPVALFDLLAILPFYLAMVIGIDLRFLRVLRLLRIFKLTRYSSALKLLLAVFKEEARPFVVTLFILLVVMIMVSGGMYLVEREAQPEAFGSIPATMWWAMVTLTTVGYGDVTPITPLGKFFGACITIIGIGMVALPSGLLASGFSDQLHRRRERYKQEVDDTLEKQVVTEEDHRKLEKLREELDFSEEEAMEILNEAAHYGRFGRPSYCPHCGRPLNLQK